MKTGLIFDIKEFALNDGPGIRLTVFMKGCPLSCKWCHNPEGISTVPQLNLKTNKMVGEKWRSASLIEYILKFKDVFDSSGGGVTFSGGEPTAQHEFLIETLKGLKDVHTNLDTSGYCTPENFKEIIKYTNLVFFDVKLVSEEQHKKYTGVSNKKILKNLEILSNSSIKYHIRIPLIPDITDTKENLESIEKVISNLKNRPAKIDLLPFNSLAGAKYPTYNMKYSLENRETSNNSINIGKFKMLEAPC